MGWRRWYAGQSQITQEKPDRWRTRASWPRECLVYDPPFRISLSVAAPKRSSTDALEAGSAMAEAGVDSASSVSCCGGLSRAWDGAQLNFLYATQLWSDR